MDGTIGEYIVREVNLPMYYYLNSNNEQIADVDEEIMEQETTFDNTYSLPVSDICTNTITKTLSGATPPSEEEFEIQISIPGEVEELYASLLYTSDYADAASVVRLGFYSVR